MSGSQQKNLFWSAFWYEISRPVEQTFSGFLNDKSSHAYGINAARYEILLHMLAKEKLPDKLVKYPKNGSPVIGVDRKKYLRGVIGESFGVNIEEADRFYDII